MARQIRNHRRRHHVHPSCEVSKRGSVRPPGARVKRGTLVQLAIAFGLAISSTACAPRRVTPLVDLRVAGAQIPAELTASWLRRSSAARFRVEFVQPIKFSDSGFLALADDRCDLACTDRLIQSRERERLEGEPFAGRRIAFYGYAFYVHPTNVLDNIFGGHVKLLMRGRITDWKELGGRAGPIHLVGPEKSTRGGEILMRQAGLWFREPPWKTCASDSQIIDQVAIDPFALGFASIGFDQGARYLGLRMERNGKPAFPSIEEIESERYGLAKVIYVYYRSPPSDAVRAALAHLSSEAGRRAIEHSEAWPIPPERAAVPS